MTLGVPTALQGRPHAQKSLTNTKWTPWLFCVCFVVVAMAQWSFVFGDLVLFSFLLVLCEQESERRPSWVSEQRDWEGWREGEDCGQNALSNKFKRDFQIKKNEVISFTKTIKYYLKI